ncbi:MAG TPA: cyclopropane-fatty-acyl-phospholipid synthase family protein [Thermoanaerobaculaceae bacterium]|nr:cyclopropane-fatty-acyl-phospholipid synthase family protein [Thermoanaerobaculaceae bacterium]HRS14845.1 cyclopropane-fatty-acyl-phospholipid synthase family protein [Thermoanaerobaculaceae bacterium]
MSSSTAARARVEDHRPGAEKAGWRERLAQKAVLARLARLGVGRLEMIMPDGGRLTFGPGGAPEARLVVHHPRFFWRLLAASDVGAGESFMAREWDSPDLPGLVRLFSANAAVLDTPSLFSRLGGLWGRLQQARRRNTRLGSRRNVAAHYDLSNEFYRLFLDPGMTYSAALFEHPGQGLEAAQHAKLQAIAAKARLRPGLRVLEIGCGWGSFAELAARLYGCHVTGLTLSEAQAGYARARFQRAGVADRAEVRIEDWRDAAGSYDRIVSIEMLEAVGHEYLGAFFAAVDRLLAPGGIAVVQTITIADQRYDAYRRGTDFIRRYIFPGGHLPSLSVITGVLARRTRLVVRDVESLGPHYARTLRRWRERFVANRERVFALGFDDRFCRMWEFYLGYCEGGFEAGVLDDLQLVLARPGCEGGAGEDSRAGRRGSSDEPSTFDS